MGPKSITGVQQPLRTEASPTHCASGTSHRPSYQASCTVPFAELTLKREFLGLSFKLPSPIGARNYILIYSYTNQQVWLHSNQLEHKIWINQNHAIWTNQNCVFGFPIGIKIDQLGTSMRTFSIKGRLPLFCLFGEHFPFPQFANYSRE